MSSEPERRRRLFFALWPDDATREALTRVARSLPRQRGRPVPERNLHITLAFVGAVDASAEQCLIAQAARIEAEAFQLTLTHIGHFRRSRILWLGADSCPAPLNDLAQQLNRALEMCGLKPDLKPYSPHVTLLRDAMPAPAKIEVPRINWRAENFYLMESQTGAEGAQYNFAQGFDLLA